MLARPWEQELEAAAFEIEAEHDSRYRAARQQYLRQLLADPQQPRYILGWIRNELRRLEQIGRAEQLGRRGPGGSRRNLRGVPGMDVGHALGKHNQHQPSHFRLEHASTNRARPGISRRIGLFAKYREAELLEAALEQAANQLEREAPEPFYTKVSRASFGPGSQEGHEILTRLALRGLPLSTDDRTAIEDGVIRPDRGGRSYWNFPRAALGAFSAAAQSSHSLRPTPESTTGAALRYIQARFAQLHGKVMTAPTSREALEWMGEAVHLLQDSFSKAHVARAGGLGRIQRVRAFFIRAGWPPVSRGPDEHNVPSDERDDIYEKGAMRPEAQAAVRASRQYLEMALRHRRSPASPSNRPELRAFMGRYLSA